MSTKQKYYPTLTASADFPALEKETLAFWDKENIFQQSIQNRAKSDEFVFYDGPPFANGLPHYGHILTSYVKDVVPRYQTMKGKRVERRFGWDCHGLPAEMEAEKHLGVSGRGAIMDYGIGKFNAVCRERVLMYAKEWENTITRMARWVDFKNDYKTMDLSYMESLLWAFKSLYDKNLVYEGVYSIWYSYAAETPVSNFETRMDNSYREREDTAVTIMFDLHEQVMGKPTKMLVWTTTPWTLPSNFALCVGDDIDYAVMEENGVHYILGEGTLDKYKQQLKDATRVGTVKGKELVGKTYTPLFDFFKDTQGAFRVISAEFVSTEDGTGVVHVAPFGEDDLRVMRAEGISWHAPVDMQGRFTKQVPPYAGMLVFDANDPIIAYLKENRKLVKREVCKHMYPHCWRTDTPLINMPLNSWYVKVTDFKDRLVAHNKDISWIPEHIRDGQMGKWLEGARDWSISRMRFWGTPIPVWKSDDPNYPRVDVYGSIAELERDFGVPVTDLHRPFIDSLTRPNPNDPTGKSTMRRVEDVFDCWFESGSMPFAQVHYPFENKQWFETHFPADFIVEYVAQTRGWFYTMMIMATALFDKKPFQTSICHGVVLAEDGQKLSKRLRNYPEPSLIFDTVGSDALRWFLMSSSILEGGNLSIDKEGKEISKSMRKALLPFWNAFYFFCLYANAEGVKASEVTTSSDVLDRYILSKLRELSESVTCAMDTYHIVEATERVETFLEILNNWYIRRSRARFWDGTDQAAFDTLYTVLVTLSKLLAPLMPFMTEYVYRSLTGEKSVHLTDWPTVGALPNDAELTQQMDLVRAICSTAKAVREDKKLRNRLPLASMTVAGERVPSLTSFTDIIKDEINVKEVGLIADIDLLATPFLYLVTPLIGKRLGPYMKDIMAASKTDEWVVREDGTLFIAGHVLNADEFELRLVLKDGITGMALSDNTAVVQLDTTIYPELEEEGIARDFVRMVQTIRKEKDFDVSDRVNVSYIASTDLIAKSLLLHENYIMEQVLARKVLPSKALDTSDATEELGDGTVQIFVEKV